MNNPRHPVAPGASPVSPVGLAPTTYEHVSLDDYTSRLCAECGGDREVWFIALDSTRYQLGDCNECGGTGKVRPYCQCGEPVTGGSDDGDNSVCHSCQLVFHRDEKLEGWGLAEAAWAMPLRGRSGAVPAEPAPVSGLRPPAAIAKGDTL